MLSFKLIPRQFFFWIFAATLSAEIGFSQTVHPVYKPNVSNLDEMKRSVEPLMNLSLEELKNEVPSAGHILYLGCPNCFGGSEEGERTRWHWEPGMGSTLRCNYCKMVFPNEKFPNNREKVVTAPSSAKQVYRYYENPQGRTYYFEAHTWNIRARRLQPMAEALARLWYATKDNNFGDRAAVITGRYAQVFPDWPVRYDYPNVPVRFFPADQKWPYEGIGAYRGAKWSDWGYHDIPTAYLNIYDILQSGYDWKRMDKIIGPETDKRIARDLLRMSYEFTTANPETYGNMSPGMYRDMLKVGRILKEPAMVHEAVKRFREFFSSRFFADGWWNEGATSYHNQTINGLRSVADALKGYSDPADWKGERIDNLDLAVGIPLYQKALNVTRDAVFPNGRAIPLNDTWARDRRSTDNPGPTVSRLWPTLGNAALGSGKGENQIMLNLNWSGNYGHSHYDNGSIMLFAAGQELLSDIGYTHTKYRGWTLSTASHNGVVIDQTDQDRGTRDKPVTGNLKFYDDKDPHVKVIDLDASPAYAIANTYRRRLVMVNAGPGRDYIIDRFDVEGGNDHDWFLHGMCEQEGTLETSIAIDHAILTLVPEWGGKNMPLQQVDTDPKRFHPYVYMRDVKSGSASEKPWTATWRYDGGAGLRVHNLSQAGTQAFRFRSPSVRPAAEDGNKLDDFLHNGIMQRHSGNTSTFISIHEPFRNEPWIESVMKDGDALVVRYKLNGSAVEDRISIIEGQITVNSSAGWKYNSGKARLGKVEGLQTAGGKYRLQLDKEAPRVNFVRLDLANGQTRFYPVAASLGKTLELVDDPGFTITAGGKMVFHTFPQDQHEGPLHYTLFVP